MSGQPVNPSELAPPSGFSHGVMSGPGRMVHIAGETGHHEDMSLDEGFVLQFARACRNVAAVVEDVGGTPSDVVSLTIYATDVAAYRENLEGVGEAYRSVFGKHYPAMALIGVSELVDPRALVEITGVAVIEDDPADV